MDEILRQLYLIGLVPVVKINDASKAVSLAKALNAGGLPCVEITFRTAAAAESIRSITEACPNMVVGAGTVLTTAQVDEAVDAGARFIVSPGFNPEVVDYCLERPILMIPGVSDASGIEQCLARGIDVVKFFPAEQAGGLPYLTALSGPYANVRFMPTGGIDLSNLTSYSTNPLILACGGTWMVGEDLIDEGRFDEVERLCREAIRVMLGLKLARVGIGCADKKEARSVAQLFCTLMGVEPCEDSRLLCADTVEALVDPGRGQKGYIALSTIDIVRAVASLRRQGIAFDDTSAVLQPDGRLMSIYLADEVAGFDIILCQQG